MVQVPRIHPAAAMFLLLLAALGAYFSFGLPRHAQAGPEGICGPVATTTSFTFAWGGVTLDGIAAPVGSIIEARNPRGDRVGCQVTMASGYPFMRIYGEDTSVPGVTIPGMRAGETVAFYVDGNPAMATPSLVWSNDWTSHQVTLSATRPPPAPPKAPVGMQIELSDDDLLLTWQPVEEDASGNAITVSGYRVYSSLTDAYFLSGTAIDFPTTNSSVQVGAGKSTSNHYYLVRAVGPGGLLSPNSSRVGKFIQTLVGG
jgi:hypothetical protein